MVEPARLFDDADRWWRRQPPTAEAIRAFGVDVDRLVRMPGGQGQTWTDGRLVLKPVGCVPEHTWICDVYAAWADHDEVRVPEPVLPAGRQGADQERGWTVDNWGAHVFLPGRELDLPDEIDVVREASMLFHRVVAGLPRPAFLDARDDPWAFGDRLAWEHAQPEGDRATLAVIEELRTHLEPVASPDQVVHGDVLPNVLVADGLPPAVIDWPVYFRPAAWADAIAVTDAVTFRGASYTLLDAWARDDDWDQLLIRALLYRLGPTGFFTVRNSLMGGLVTHLERVRPVVDAVLARLKM